MRDPARIPVILDQLKEIWLKYPDLRLGQLIENTGIEHIMYLVEDKNLIEILKTFYRDRSDDEYDWTE